MDTDIEVKDKYNVIYSGTADEMQVTHNGDLIAKIDYFEAWADKYKNEAIGRIMQVASAMNNTYGAGINPEIVPELLKQAIYAIHDLKFLLKELNALKPGTYSASTTIDKLKSLINNNAL